MKAKWIINSLEKLALEQKAMEPMKCCFFYLLSGLCL